jgi:uncharacterized protein YggE
MNRYVALVALLISATALADRKGPPPPPPPLTEEKVLVPGQNIVIVSGTGTISMAPDQVELHIGVETDGEVIRAIVEDNNQKMRKIVEQLKALGVRADEIRTSSFVLTSREKDDVKIGSRVTNGIRLVSKDPARSGDLVQAAIESGANEISGPEFSVSNEKTTQDRCLKVAFADAKSKATQLAELSERQLGRVLAVTDGSSSPFELKYREGVEGGVLGGIVMEPGLHEVNCGVTVAFQLQ